MPKKSEINTTETQGKSLKKNYIYNLIYQLFAILTPLITTPYVSRVLGSSGIGQYAFTYSIVSYFVLFGAFGFGYYAQREIARVRESRLEQTKVFYEIVIARSLSVLLALVIHIVLILAGIYGNTYSILMWILTINIASTAFDITFLFQGNEEFGIIALRNIIIRLIGIILIMAFVKNETHVWLYALCQAIALIASNFSLWTRLPKKLVKVSVKELNIKRHFLPTLRLFIPTIAVSVYTMLDKTLIGVLIPGTNENGKNISDIENGYYDNAEKIVKMAMTVVTSLSVVMISRNSHVVSRGEMDQFKNNVLTALRFVLFIGTPIMFGLAAISFNFSPWFFGPGFEKVPILIILMCPLVILIGLSSVLGLQYLLPLKKDKKYTIAITTGALVNLTLNIVLIFLYKSYGAAIATIVSELVVTIIMFVFAKKDVGFLSLFATTWKYLLSGLIMFGIVFATQFFLEAYPLFSLLLIIEGIFSYFLSLLILKDSFLLGLIKNRIQKPSVEQDAINSTKKTSRFVKILKYWKTFLSFLIAIVSSFLLAKELNHSIVNAFLVCLSAVSIFFTLSVILKDDFVLNSIIKVTELFSEKEPLRPSNKKRDTALDMIKVLAIFLVVIMHTIEKDLSDLNYLLYCLGVFAMPLFFMVDGSLLLNKGIVTYKYCVKKIAKILFISFFWSITAFLIFGVLSKDFSQWHVNIFGWFIQKGHVSMFWFFGSLVIIYLLLPILQWIFNKKVLRLVSIIVLLICSISIYSLSFFTSLNGGYVFESRIIQTFRLYQWLFYFFLGGLLYSFRDKIINALHTVAFLKTPFIVLLMCIGMFYCYCMGKQVFASTFCEYHYSSPIIILLVMAIFVFSLIRSGENNIIMTRLAQTNICVYVLHVTYANRFFSHFNNTIILYRLLVPLMIYFCCAVFGYIVINIKYVKRVFTL